jgi:hypothetical protein
LTFALQSESSKEIKEIKSKTTKQVESKIDSSKKSNEKKTGYCIRTGASIPFDLDKPLSYESYKIWNEFGDPDYVEKFCHFSGEPSFGETSVNKPILKKNWKKAKETYGL